MRRGIVVRFAAIAVLVLPLCARAVPDEPAGAPAPLEGARMPCGESEHHLRFVNRCDEDVWLAEVGNSAGYCTQDSQCQQTPAGIQFCDIPGCASDADCPALSCTTSGDCPPGGACVDQTCTGVCDVANGTCYCSEATGCPGGGQCTAGSPFATCQGGLCTFSTIKPKGRGLKRWRLAAPHKSWRHAVTVCAPETWQGRFWARTGCRFHDGKLTCVTGQCGEGDVVCAGQSANGVTIFEPTFDAPAGQGTVDYYDVSLVSGYNVPVEVKPSVATCVVTGGCTTDLNTTCPAPLRITDGACSTDADCKTGTCLSGSCVVGCSDPCTICTNDPTNATLDCASNMDEYCCHGDQQTNTCNSGSATCADDNDCKNLGNGSVNGTCNATTRLCEAPCTTNADCPGSSCNTAIGQCANVVVGCSAQQSCPVQTAPQPTATCEAGIFAGGDVCVPQTDCCGPYNPDWLAAAAVTAGGGAAASGWPNVFKAACPTAYSYQYDDPSSTFTCAPVDDKPNRYKITFCPG